MKSEFDVGQFRTRLVIQPHEGRVYVERTQRNEEAILRHNAELRKLEQRKMEWGRQVACIPQIAMPQLYREYPDLRSNDHKARDRALFKVLAAHPEWRVVSNDKIWARPTNANQKAEGQRDTPARADGVEDGAAGGVRQAPPERHGPTSEGGHLPEEVSHAE